MSPTLSSQKSWFCMKTCCCCCIQPQGSRLEQHTQQLSVKNVSSLPVTSVLLCSYPFSLVREGVALAQMVSQHYYTFCTSIICLLWLSFCIWFVAHIRTCTSVSLLLFNKRYLWWSSAVNSFCRVVAIQVKTQLLCVVHQSSPFPAELTI